MKEIWNRRSPNCSRKSAHLFMPFGRSNTCGHPLLTRTPRTLKYLHWREQVAWNARLNPANAHFQKGKPTFVWSQHVCDFLQLLRLHPVWDVFGIWSESKKKIQPESCKDFGLLVFIVSSLWSANKSAVPRNRPHGRFAAHDQSLQAIDCRTWRIWDTHPAERWKKYCKGSHVESSNPFISFIREAPCWTSRKKIPQALLARPGLYFFPFCGCMCVMWHPYPHQEQGTKVMGNNTSRLCTTHFKQLNVHHVWYDWMFRFILR